MQAEIDEFLDFIMVEKGYSRHTHAAYQCDLSQFVVYLTGEDVTSWDSTTRQHILNYILYLRERGYVHSTTARKMAAVRSFFKFLVADGKLLDNPTDAVESPQVNRHLPHPLNPSEVAQLLSQAASSQTPRALRDLAILEMMYATGMRASEVIQLSIDAVDLAEGTVRCRGKGDKERLLPLYERAVTVLQMYLDRGRPSLLGEGESNTLFVNHRGKPLSRQGLWRIVKEHGAAAGIGRDVTPHMLRHSFATHLLDGGAGLREVQHLLGHANITTTQIYTEVSKRRQRAVYDRAHPRARSKPGMETELADTGRGHD